MTGDRVVIAYIAGYGRSGSTLLDRMLSQLDGVVGLGECAFLPDMMAESETVPCSCGVALEACVFWGPVVQRLLPTVTELGGWAAVSRDRLAAEAWLPWRRNQGRRYSRFVREFVSAAAATSPSARVFVDSSKSARLAARRPAALASSADCDVRVIHLVRDGRAVLWSVLRGTNSSLESGNGRPARFPVARTILSYTVANYFAGAMAADMKPDGYLLVRYEDIVAQPDRVLDSLAAFVGVTFAPDWATRGVPEAHRFAGNRNRFDKELQVRPDHEWRSRLPFRVKVAWQIFGWPSRVITRLQESRQ